MCVCVCLVVYFKEHVKHLYCKGHLDSTDSEDEDTSGSMYFDDSLSLLEFRGRHCHWPPACNCWWIIWSLCFSGSYKYRFFRSLPRVYLPLLLFSPYIPPCSQWVGQGPCPVVDGTVNVHSGASRVVVVLRSHCLSWRKPPSYVWLAYGKDCLAWTAK